MTTVPTVFVHPDGAVEQRVMERDWDLFRVPIRRPVAMAMRWDDAPRHAATATIDYRRTGHMMDGRPILTAPGFVAKEAAMEIVISREVSSQADAVLDDEVRRFVGDAIPLDKWIGEPPLLPPEREALHAAHQVKVQIRVVVARRLAMILSSVSEGK